jgi:hypothetical protein
MKQDRPNPLAQHRDQLAERLLEAAGRESSLGLGERVRRASEAGVFRLREVLHLAGAGSRARLRRPGGAIALLAAAFAMASATAFAAGALMGSSAGRSEPPSLFYGPGAEYPACPGEIRRQISDLDDLANYPDTPGYPVPGCPTLEALRENEEFMAEYERTQTVKRLNPGLAGGHHRVMAAPPPLTLTPGSYYPDCDWPATELPRIASGEHPGPRSADEAQDCPDLDEVRAYLDHYPLIARLEGIERGRAPEAGRD